MLFERFFFNAELEEGSRGSGGVIHPNILKRFQAHLLLSWILLGVKIKRLGLLGENCLG